MSQSVLERPARPQPAGDRSRGPAAGSVAAAGGARWITAVVFYFALLFLAFVFKYFGAGWGDYRRVPADFGRAHRVAEILRRIFMVYRADVLEAFLLVALVVVLFHLLARIRVAAVAWVTLTVLVLTGAAAVVAFRKTGVPLTHGTLMISLEWAWQHPEVIPTIVPVGPSIAFLLAAVAYGAIPWLLTRWVTRGRALPGLRRALPAVLAVAAVAAIVVACFTPGPLLPAFTKSMSPAEGFWSSTLAALADIDPESPVRLDPGTVADVRRAYDRVAYPGGRPVAAAPIATIAASPRPLHVVVVVLETAPYAYYPLGADSSLHTFQAMAARSLVAGHHLATRPYTLFAIYSILTGSYPRPGAPIGEYGAFRTDGLAGTLGARGWESTYIDSYKVDWGYHYRDELVQQGFRTILDTAEAAPRADVDPFAQSVERERWSFAKAEVAIAGAEGRGKKALVVVATTLGHFPWRAPRGQQALPAAAKLHGVAEALDAAMGEFLGALDRRGLRDSVIVVVTGDHGLRYSAEYESFGQHGPFGDTGFHVPFLLYAPSLVARRVDIAHPTSHVDVAPTLYAMLGIPVDSMLVHGENMLDGRLASRATFMMGTGISPIDAFELAGRRYESNSITRDLRVVPPPAAPDSAARRWTPGSVRALLDDANHVFNLTAAAFLRRARGAGR